MAGIPALKFSGDQSSHFVLVDDRARGRSHSFKRNLFRELGKSSQEFLQRQLFADSLIAEHRQQGVPIGVASVQLPQLVLNVNIGGVRDEGRVPKFGRERVNRPASCSVTASVFRMSWNAAIFSSGKSKPSPSMSTQTTILDSPLIICRRIFSRSFCDLFRVELHRVELARAPDKA